MILKQIEIAGFRGVRTSQQVPFGSAFTVITGLNGSGKTTVCDAIELALSGNLNRYPSTLYENGERIEDYIWCRDGVQMKREVRATFIESDGTEFERHIGPDLRISGAGNERFFEPGSSPPNAMSRLVQTTIIRDELIGRFSTELAEADRFDFVHKTIGTTSLTSIEKRATYISDQVAKLLRSAEENYAKERSRVSDLVGQLSEARLLASKIANENIQEIRTRLSILFNLNADSTQGILTPLEMRIRELRNRTSSLERLRLTCLNLRRASKERELLAVEASALNDRLVELTASVEVATDDLAAATERLASAQSSSPQDSSLAQLREQGMRLGLRDGHCPLCGSRISAEDFNLHLDELKRELDVRNATLAKLVQEQANLTVKQAENKRQFELLSAEYGRCRSDLDAINEAFSAADQSAKSLEVPLDVSAIEDALRHVRDDLSALEKDREILNASLATGRIADLEQSKSEAVRITNELASRISLLTTAGQNAKSSGDSIKRVAWEVVDERLASLSPLLSEMYVRLRPHMAYSDLIYRTRGDVKRFLSFSVGRDINPRFTFSSGQSRALGLAFLLSVHLARPWCRLQSLILDDPIQHIDDYRSLHLVETLAAIRQLGRQIICTVEDGALAELLCRRLRAENPGDGILLELEYDPHEGTIVRRRREFSPLPRAMLVSA